MAVDNPSYFSLSGGESVRANDPLVQRREGGNGPTAGNGRTFAAFFRKRSTSGKLNATSDYDDRIIGSVSATAENEEILPMLGGGQRQNSKSVASKSGRKSFRSLFRSMSANMENERTRQILKGDPRPSDVAPPSPYLPHRSHSHSENDRRERPIKRRMMKSASELLSNDMIYCGLPTEDNNDAKTRNQSGAHSATSNVLRDEDDVSDNDQVFLGVENARYYNISENATIRGNTMPQDEPRRHSIGTFLTGREQRPAAPRTDSTNVAMHTTRMRVQKTGFIKEPDEMAPPIPTIDQVDSIERRADSRINRRCRIHDSASRKGSRGRKPGAKLDSRSSAQGDRDDVLFVSSKESETSALWVNYLSACFEQISQQQGRAPFRVRHVTVEDSSSANSAMQEKISRARLQIVVVCPVLLDRVTTRPEQASSLAKQLSPQRVLAMMLGVHDGHLTENHRNVLVNYAEWRKFFVKDQDETFVGEFLGAAVVILGTNPATSLRNDKTTFSIHPKKVKMGQSRVMVVLNEPLKTENNVTVMVDRCGDAIEIDHVKRRNPYVLQFSIPDRCLEVSMLIGVRVMIDGCPQGVKQVKCESRLRELDQILRAHDNPLEFMCQTFGFNPGDREQLDNWMVNAFQKNLPPHFDLLSTSSGAVPLQRNHIVTEEYPTLLHFAARFGLEKLAWQLLECPGGDVACDLKNIAELTPADLAEQSNHSRLAHQLRGYMQMNEFTNMYSYLKVISESTSNRETANESAPSRMGSESVCSELENDKDDYCRPRPLSEAYSVPPAARPITVSTSNIYPPPQSPPPNYSVVPPPTPIFEASITPTPSVHGLDLPLQGYLKMNPAGLKSPTERAPTPTTAPLTGSLSSLRLQMANQASTSKREVGPSTPTFFGAKSRDQFGPQDELVEIINDFKNNVFTISEVERLVENWRNRNDVRQSFKDKQRQLIAMRDEYERIQKRIKDEMKAPTPFDRIKKFFSKSKKDFKDSSGQSDDAAASVTNKTNVASGNLTDRRPISSLSLHSVSSSSSSGRMSIISGCSGTSLGDSGTHSDPEDRRAPRGPKEDKGGVMTYEIPPAPKPFTGRYSPLRYALPPNSSATSPGPQPGDSEYYIAFPVSGLPIHSFHSNGTPIEPKTPNSPCDQAAEYLTDKLNDLPKISTKAENAENMVESKILLPPPPPPGMCIPFDYINVRPSGQILTDIERTPTNNPKDCRNATENTVESTNIQREMVINETPAISMNNGDEISPAANNNVTDNCVEYSTSDDNIECNDPSECQVTDSPKMPDYMNIAASNNLPSAASAAGKKMPAPPVPPRIDSCLG